MSMAAMVGLLLISFLQMPEWHVTIKPVVGSPVTGKLTDLSGTQLVVTTDEGVKTFEQRDVLTIAPAETPELPENDPSIWIELMGGTAIPAGDYSADEKLANIYLLGGEELEVPLSAIRWVRFNKPRPAVAQQWDEFIGGALQADRVIIRRQEASLDKLDGILHEVAAEKVQFEFNDTKIPVDRERLEGIVYHHPPAQLPNAVCRVTTRDGAVWHVRSMTLADGQLAISSVAGAERSIPLGDVLTLDFSSGNVVYLSDLDPVSIDWTPYLSSRIAPDRLARLYEPRRDESLEGGKLSLGDGPQSMTYEKGLAIHSRTEIVYRLTQEYRQFTAVAGIDSQVRSHGHVELVIFGDDRELFRRTVTGRDEAVDLALDIQGVRRLRILVDFGQELDIADHLNLCDARILK